MAREPRCGRSTLSSLRGQRRLAGAWEAVVLALVASVGPSEAADPAQWPQPGPPRVPAPPCPDPPAGKRAGKPVPLRPARPSAGRYLWAGVSRAGAGGSGSMHRAAQATLPCPLLPPLSQRPPSFEVPGPATGLCA